MSPETDVIAKGQAGRELNKPARTVLVGLVGRSIQRSRTPSMHEAEGACQGLHYIYRLIDLDRFGRTDIDVGDIHDFAQLCGFSGLNVTFPFKQAVLPCLDALSEAARRAEAVNTIVFREGKRFGHNTDLWGFAESFRRGMGDVARRHVLLIGAGGAGSAVAHALLDCGVERLAVFDTQRNRAEELAARLRIIHNASDRVSVWSDPAEDVAILDGLVNATPIGMSKCPGIPFPAERLQAKMWVADIIYFPLETELLRAARAKGCRTLGGSGMAVFQAVRAFELFTGLRADNNRMKAAFDSLSE